MIVYTKSGQDIKGILQGGERRPSVALSWAWMAAVVVLGASGVPILAEQQGDPASPSPAAVATGQLVIDVTDVLGQDLPAQVELQGTDAPRREVVEVPEGKLEAAVPVGQYRAYVYVYVLGVPVMVEAKDVTVTPDRPAYILVNLLEGASGNRSLLDFDGDCDFAIDRVEKACGTDPEDARSIPGRKRIVYDARVFEDEEGWRRGELHAHSIYGVGKETVARLVRRAEKAGLDFLAIADRNTMAACKDPEFKSDSVVLIPAMEWGNDERGVSLVYGPATFPGFVKSIAQAQALVDLVQAQGGFWAIAHPCFPTAPWQWGLAYVNGVEVWCREWNAVPPLSPTTLIEDMTERHEGKYVHSIAFAAASAYARTPLVEDDGPLLSANGQAAIFYDSELVRGLKAAVIAGSHTASPKVAMAEPVTYVYAAEKSVRGILDGMRRGRTYVSSGLKGPRIRFCADVLQDGTVDVSLGGIIPYGVPTRFHVVVENAKGQDLQVLLNGYPLISKQIEGKTFALDYDHTPENYAVYRVRVVGPATAKGFGARDVLAMTSPIYAEELDLDNPELKEVKAAYQEWKKRREAALEREPGPPTDPGQGEIIPKWRF